MKQIENGLRLEEGTWLVTYPWKRDPRQLPDNKGMALAVLKSTEKRLLKNREDAKVYKEQMQDMLNRGASRKVNEEEVKGYTGPIHYINHHAVIKPESLSTPCRILFNSSANFCGYILRLLGQRTRYANKPVRTAAEI